ncbi:serine/threonine-protein kinase [Actinoplanes sp. L3-i22]|uniref:serine/threonine-protein kinase n=1 Tax=Actinoplanes sp. L3-i22 TaxID=2836373 RepID=UPI001C85F406|nr:serine/threonine-protein kinase [Actinoplanes sp. L3-i22]
MVSDRRAGGFNRDDLRLGPPLGGGGMGEVFLAQTPDGQVVAVKVISPGLLDQPDARQRFAAEIAAAERVTSHFTARIIKSDPTGEPPYFVMQYVAGPSLAEVVHRRVRFDDKGLRALAAGLAEAFIDIHAQGLVHRDLKPGNVLLDLTGPRVIDFGISRPLKAKPVTAEGDGWGTPGFIPPERYRRNSSETDKSDIWGIAAVVWYAMTGQTVDPRHPPAKARFPAQLRVLADCLARRPGRRPTALQLRQQLFPGDRKVEELFYAGWLPPQVIERIQQERRRCDQIFRAHQNRARPVPPTRYHQPARAAAGPRRRRRFLLAAVLCLVTAVALGWVWSTTRDHADPESAPPQAAPSRSLTVPATPAPTSTCAHPGGKQHQSLPFQCEVTWVNDTVPVFRSPDSSPAPFASLQISTGDQWFRCHRQGPPYQRDGTTSTWWAYTRSDTKPRTWGWVPEVYLPQVRDNPAAMKTC